MSEVIVRRARPDDIDGLVALVDGLFREDGGRHDATMNVRWPQQEGAAYYTPLLDDPAGVVLLAVAGDDAVGYLVGRLRGPVTIRPVRVAVLESMRVLPECRGAGTGGLLVDAFFRWAAAEGATEATVTAYAANTTAQRFYARHGFAPHEVTLRTAVDSNTQGPPLS